MSIGLDELLTETGAIARRLEGFEVRPQQIEMAAAIHRTLDARGRLVVEAGTGIGKSFAYLIPAIKRIVEDHERVVVATNTINLQEQLIEKDLPLLQAVIPDEFSAVLVKGRQNYLSLRRLKLASSRQDRLFGDDEARHSLHLIEQWAYHTRDGTLSTLPQLPRPEVWDYAQSDTHNCMGRRCPTFDKCFYQAARRRMHNGDLLICNHALFFADLALRSRDVAMLPTYNHLVLDEAHAVEDVAAEHFGLSISEGGVVHLLNMLFQPRTGRGFLSALKLAGEAGALREQAIEQSVRCRAAADEVFRALWEWQRSLGPANGRITEPQIVANGLSPELEALVSLLKLLRERTAEEPDRYELNSYIQRAMAMGAELSALVEQRSEDAVYWLEAGRRRAATGGRRQMKLCCMPIEVGPILREHLFGRETSVVLTSATLATSPGDFSHLLRRLGCEGTETLQLGSPFDHSTQMRVYVDASMPTPDHQHYVQQLVPRIARHVQETSGGAFVLFTSFAMLNRCAEALRPLMVDEGCPMLVQDQDGPRNLLLRRFKDDQRSVLLGTASFWQGVDVRGQGLRNVIITRLPFDVPDRPLLEARSERIKQRGGDPFRDDQIPRAVIRFKQGVGRLIRSTTDTGRIVVLDPRIGTKWYGRKFLEALPEGVRTIALDETGDELYNGTTMLGKVFKAYDIRAIYPKPLNEKLAWHIGHAVGQYLTREAAEIGHDDPMMRHIIVGRDMRTSSPALAQSLKQGIRDFGAHVVDVGMVDTPFVPFAINHLGCCGGVQVTASHNPANYNGFKISKIRAMPVGMTTGLDEIRRFAALVDRDKATPRHGREDTRDLWDAYRQHATQALEPALLDGSCTVKAVIDASNGMAGTMVPKVFGDVPGLKITRVNFDNTNGEFVHEPNPLVEANLAQVRETVREVKADVGFCFDGDADRCVVVDENGDIVGCDLLTAWLSQGVLRRHPGARVVYDLRSSRSVPEMITEAGGKPVRSRVGHVFMKEVMAQHDAVFGGELSGHFYFRENFYADSGAMALAEVAGALARADRPLSELIRPARRYVQTGEINFETEDKDEALEELKETFDTAKIDELDGVTLDFGSWWCNVRPSNTEPLLRLNLEGPDVKTVNACLEDVAQYLGRRVDR